MTVYNVSGQNALLSALNDADGNDTIVLSGGNYGSITLSERYASNVTITSASASNQAVFKSFVANSVSNLTIDRVTFAGSLEGGYGDGIGLKLSKGSNITVENSTFSAYRLGIQVWGTNNVDILNNQIKNISHDGMTFGHTNNVLIQGNDINMNARPGVDHKDNIQFFNEGTLAPASNITIRNNSLNSDDGMTHGIFMGNADAKAGKSSEFYKNVLIEGNSGETGHRLGLAVAQTDGLTIRGNQVLQNGQMDSSKTVNTPVILVHEDSTRVSITGNTVLDVPSAANDSWADTKPAGGGWSIIGNKIVSLGTGTGSDGGSGSGSGGGGTVAPSLPAGDGGADDFRYNGGNIDGSERVVFNNVDFKEGDRILLSNFDDGTFRHYAGDNAVWASADRSATSINSLVDIQELVTAAPDVKAVFQANNTLVVRIAQDDGTLDIALPGYAAAYSNTFNADLF